MVSPAVAFFLVDGSWTLTDTDGIRDISYSCHRYIVQATSGPFETVLATTKNLLSVDSLEFSAEEGRWKRCVSGDRELLGSC